MRNTRITNFAIISPACCFLCCVWLLNNAALAQSSLLRHDFPAESTGPLARLDCAVGESALLQSGSVSRSIRFEVTSIRPSGSGSYQHVGWKANGYELHGLPLIFAIIAAYFPSNYVATDWADHLVSQSPSWVRGENYDIEAQLAPEDIAKWEAVTPNNCVRREALAAMLQDRFKLVVELIELPIPSYLLEANRNNLHLERPSSLDNDPKSVIKLNAGGTFLPITDNSHPVLRFFHTSMDELAQFLSSNSNRPVVNSTRLVGSFNFSLFRRTADLSGDLPLPTNFILSQIGLHLVAHTSPSTGLRILNIERPSEN